MHSAPKGTTLGLITYESMGLNFTGKKSDLTGLCEILNNFDLKFQKNSQKFKNLSMTGHISEHRIKTFNLAFLMCLTCWSTGSVLDS